MKKRDLKQGAIVQIRYGSILILIGKKFVDLTRGDWLCYDDYSEDLIDFNGSRTLCFKYDIVKVFNPNDENIGYKSYVENNISWTWEREEVEVKEVKKQINELKRQIENIERTIKQYVD